MAPDLSLVDQFRPDVAYWQGRTTELQTLRGWIAEPGIRLIGITAAGGYGKSALASKLYDEVTGFDQKIWVTFSQAYSFALWGRWLLEQFGLTIGPEAKDDEVINTLSNHLTRGKHRYFLVLDNGESLLKSESRQWQDTSYQRFLLRWVKSPGNHVVVVTSRERPELPSSSLNASQWFSLVGLDIRSGIDLLRLLGIRGDAAMMTKVVTLADGHPLLLGLLAGLLKEEEGDEPDIAVLQSGDYNLLHVMGDHRDDPEASVMGILAESLNRLEPEWQQWLQHLSVYRGAFGWEAAHVMAEATVTAKTVTAKTVTAKTVSLKDVRRFVKRSLLQEKKQDGVWVFQFQSLIQRFLQTCHPNLDQAHEQAIRYYVQQCQPLIPETTPHQGILPYLEAFYHGCELGAYEQVWDFWQTRTKKEKRYSDPSMFLKFKGETKERQSELALYQQMVDRWLPETHREKDIRADVLQSIGDVQKFLKQSDEALANYQSALSTYREVGDRWGEANTLQAIGDVQQFLKQSDEALANYQSALSTYREVGDRVGEANTLQAIGDVQQFLDQRSEALANYQSALSTYREVGDRWGEANTLCGLGQLQDDPNQALVYFGEAQDIFINIGDRYSQGRNLLMFIVTAQDQLDDTEGILHSLDQADAIGQEIGFDPFCEVAEQLRQELLVAPRRVH